MTKRETTVRLIITNLLFWLGLIVCLCAMGRLDYLTERCVAYGLDEFWIASAKGIAGLILMAAGMFVGRNVEFNEESGDDDE